MKLADMCQLANGGLQSFDEVEDSTHSYTGLNYKYKFTTVLNK